MIGYSLAAAKDVVRHRITLSEFGEASVRRFTSLLALAERRIVARPLMYRLLRDRETRRYAFKINRTSYLVDYLIEPDRIVVMRVWHGRQERPE